MSDDRIKNLLELSKLPLDKINAKIKTAEQEAVKHMDEVKAFAAEKGIHVGIDESYNIATHVQKALGGVYLRPAYSEAFDTYTSRRSNIHTIWYGVRDGIHNYFSYINAIITKKKIKMTGDPKGDGIVMIRQFNNGSAEYENTPELLERISDVKEIHSNFHPKLEETK